jgi:hypothetical protein
MKHVLSYLFAFAATTLVAFGQDANSGVTPKSQQGDFALMFDLGGLANLALNSFSGHAGDTTTTGAGFGGKYLVASDVAVRLGIILMTSSTDAPIGSDSLGLSNKFTTFRFGVMPSVTYNLVTSGPVAGYIGGQVSYTMSNATNTPADTSQRAIESNRSAFGVGALIGAEWFPWSNISLAGEYVLGFATASEERIETVGAGEPQRFELPTISTFGVNSRGVLTLSIYW